MGLQVIEHPLDSSSCLFVMFDTMFSVPFRQCYIQYANDEPRIQTR